MLLVVLIIELILTVGGFKKLLLTPLIILPIINLIIFETKYEILTFNGLVYQYGLKFLFYRKKISEFKIENIDSIEIKQDEDKYYLGFLKFKDGSEIMLDRYPTKDNLQKRISEIEVDLNLEWNK